jgi:N-acyl-D-aspartate/D-glutamate deacylase
LIQRYVLDKKVLSLETAIHKCTGLPAQSMKLRGKGLLKVGMDGDVVVFKPEELREHATFLQPRQLSSGMEYVFVQGQPAIWQGQRTHHCTGQLLLSSSQLPQ